MNANRYPSLYQLNTRVMLLARSRELGRPATLDDLPDAELKRLANLGFDWLWLLGVWQTGDAGQQVSRTVPEWQQEFRDTLPDLSASDICGSCFAVTGYTVHANMGGNAAIERLRSRAAQQGLRLMLDFVPNHTALDHPWVKTHPDYFVRGTEADFAREPRNYCRPASADGTLVLAYGRDPFFDGWPDTLQLNYGNPALQTAMRDELLKIAAHCDGLRCDMAMLAEPEVFERTWGTRPEPFWPHAIEQVRRQYPDFVFMAEVYWDMEWTLQQHGFNYTYDKRLYDRLRDRSARPVREHLFADLDFQDKLARFLENHDERRAAVAFPPEVHPAAAIVTFLTPGLRFFHQGQMESRQKRIAPHLCRGPDEPVDTTVQAFYTRLLACLKHPALRNGHWQLLECTPAAKGSESWEGFISWAWHGPDGERLLVVVNYSPGQGQCYVRLPFPNLEGRIFRLAGRMGTPSYEREGHRLLAEGLYVDLPPWGYHVFEITSIPVPASK